MADVLRPGIASFLAAAAIASLAGCHGVVADPGQQATSSASAATAPATATQGSNGPAGLVADHDPGQVTGTITGTCHYRDGGQLPDPRCTPGSIDPAVTQANIRKTICRTGYTGKVRPPAEETDHFKYKVAYRAYGIPHRKHTELDHLVSLELGGSNAAANLWPVFSPPRSSPR